MLLEFRKNYEERKQQRERARVPTSDPTARATWCLFFATLALFVAAVGQLLALFLQYQTLASTDKVQHELFQTQHDMFLESAKRAKIEASPARAVCRRGFLIPEVAVRPPASRPASPAGILYFFGARLPLTYDC
jgi:hypothetical protein